MKLETKRLILRLPENKDIPAILEGIMNINVSKWLLVVPYPYKAKDAKEWISKSRKKEKSKDRKDYTFTIELKEEKKVIGGIGIHHIDNRQKVATVGYWVNAHYQGFGYASEALKKILDFGFKELKMRRIDAEVFRGNKKSSGLLEKFGFKYEGMKRKACICKATGKVHDGVIFGLLRKEYKSLIC